METVDSSINIATFLLAAMGAAVFLSLLTLGAYFFGGRSPVERHVLGRLEANINPADVLAANRQYRSQRFAASLVGIVLVWLTLHQAAPVQTEQATGALFEAVSITLGAARDITFAAAQELGIGNGCECADPSRIGGNGP